MRIDYSRGGLASSTYREVIIKRIENRDGTGCNNCHREDEELHVHHLIPVSRGGSNNLDNLILLCKPCHVAVHRGDIEKLIERAMSNEEYK